MSVSPIVRCAVRPGAYYDSVVLMQLQRALTGLEFRRELLALLEQALSAHRGLDGVEDNPN